MGKHLTKDTRDEIKQELSYPFPGMFTTLATKYSVHTSVIRNLNAQVKPIRNRRCNVTIEEYTEIVNELQYYYHGMYSELAEEYRVSWQSIKKIHNDIIAEEKA